MSVGSDHAPCNVRLDGMDPCSNGFWCGPSVTGNGMECLFCEVPSPPLDHRAYARNGRMRKPTEHLRALVGPDWRLTMQGLVAFRVGPGMRVMFPLLPLAAATRTR